ncbi:MAG: ATP-binding protein [Micavibrio sp.]
MKIAFVGKGGSGKSTLSALFIRYLQAVRQTDVLAMDADLNMNLAGLLDVQVDPATLLARSDVQADLRTKLKGKNKRIRDANSFLPTTPPGTGSHVIIEANDSVLAPYAVSVSDQPVLRLLTVGSYEKEEIGQACYHTHLFMAENILSHTAMPNDQWVVADMVAGTDAFAYSLHLQFDAIMLIIEPTPESAEVYNLYMDLARTASVDSLIHLIANKVTDQDDLDFIKVKTGASPLVVLPYMNTLKKQRQRGEAISADHIDNVLLAALTKIEQAAQKPAIMAEERMAKLRALHEKLMQQDWVKSGYGDVSNQWDDNLLQKAV